MMRVNADIIRHRLRVLGLRQQELAAAIKVSPEHVSRILRGTCPPSADLLEMIASCLGITVSDMTDSCTLVKLNPSEFAVIAAFRAMDPVSQAKLLLHLKQEDEPACGSSSPSTLEPIQHRRRSVRRESQ